MLRGTPGGTIRLTLLRLRLVRAVNPRLPRCGGAVLLALALAACGAGLETMHESNLRFEHCYRLDMDPKIAPSHREHCWRDWTETYAYGQVLDRIEYARRRIVALESGSTELLTIHSSGPEPGRVFAEVGVGVAAEAPMAAPAPTSVTAPPPRTEPVPAPPQPVLSPVEAPKAEPQGPVPEPPKAVLPKKSAPR